MFLISKISFFPLWSKFFSLLLNIVTLFRYWGLLNCVNPIKVPENSIREVPTPRFGHAVSLANEGRLFLFGGRGPIHTPSTTSLVSSLHDIWFLQITVPSSSPVIQFKKLTATNLEVFSFLFFNESPLLIFSSYFS